MLLLTCGVDRETSESGIQLATTEHTVKAFVGVHPSEALKGGNLRWLTTALETASGVGEIGLDPKYSAIGAGSAQRKVFLTQLEAAEDGRRPVQVHSRGAESECLEVLGEFGLKSVLMHWFQSEEILPMVLKTEYFVSFGPSLLYSKKLQRMAASCNPQQVVTETDSPVPYGPLGGVHGPHLVPSVVFKLAELWGSTFEEARTTTSRNALRFLGATEKG
jgi:TatD DNase family protein